MSTELYSHADDLAAVFCASARQTFRAALGRACGLQVGARLPGSVAPTPISVRFVLTEGGQGEIALLMQPEAASILADLMMMGDGTAAWSDEHQDALQELGNQLAGAFSTSQSERWHKRLVYRSAVEEGAPGAGSACYPVELDVQGFPIHQITLTVSHELMETLSELDGIRSSQSEFPNVDEFQEGLSAHAPSEAISLPPPPQASRTAAAPASPGGTSWIDSRDPAVQRLLDVPIEVTIELGQTELSIRRILEIGPGSIIELDRMAGEPVDLVVNDKIIARGEVVVIEENFGIRITHLVTPEERARPIR
ncbi:MAG TPA: flagellar motor switch protein FliN [Fibrobacteria bacterium]|mgnify:CR=1 FL=1|nr:flagellar motor switch protein FliN [Fibrobacteria bacterium]HOX52379.1 flagellar motor switch protein FliN [Fibrobacteria bacterium]